MKLNKIISSLITVAVVASVATCYVGCEDWSEHQDRDSTTKYVIASFGHPNVGSAVEDSLAKISNLKMNQGGCTWSWGCDIGALWGVDRGASNHILAVAGYLQKDGSWKCAKFDWCRPSNTSRDFKNLNSGYNGFNPTEFWAAQKRCFFLMHIDGKRRTNILVHESK